MLSPVARRRVVLALGLVLVVLAVSSPSVAAACTVCYDPKEAGKGDFLQMTVFMSLLPLAMMSAVALFVWVKFRSRDAGLAPAAIPLERPR